MTFPAGDPDAEVMTLWRIRYWCNLAFFSRGSKKKHMSCHPVAADLPDEAAILHGKLPDEWVGDDEELDEADGEAADSSSGGGGGAGAGAAAAASAEAGPALSEASGASAASTSGDSSSSDSDSDSSDS